jgi:hypothetical protein
MTQKDDSLSKKAGGKKKASETPPTTRGKEKATGKAPGSTNNGSLLD